MLPPKVLFATRRMLESGRTCTVQHRWAVPPLSPACPRSQSCSCRGWQPAAGKHSPGPLGWRLGRHVSIGQDTGPALRLLCTSCAHFRAALLESHVADSPGHFQGPSCPVSQERGCCSARTLLGCRASACTSIPFVFE